MENKYISGKIDVVVAYDRACPIDSNHWLSGGLAV